MAQVLLRRWLGCALLAAVAVLGLPGTKALSAPPGSGWYLIHADEFSGAAVDQVKWDTQYEWGRTHNHDAYMLDSNVTVDDGVVTLTARRENSNGKPYTSGVLSSHADFRFTYGYMEMQMRLTERRGSWPAFWMLNAGWPPEIDVMEYPLFVSEGDDANEDRYYANSHWSTGSGNASNGQWIGDGGAWPNADLGGDFHTYGLEWTSTHLRYYFDGVLVKTASNQASFQNMYTIFNLAVGGWPGAPSTGQWPNGATDAASADWFRVWQKPATGTPVDTIWTYNSSALGSWTTDANWNNGQARYERQRAYFTTLAGRSAMVVSWNDSRTVGEVHLNGATTYALGQAGGDVESLMFADAVDGWATLAVDGGTANHFVNSRIDAWSNLQINHNGAGLLRITGNIVGQARPNGASPTGGIVLFTGPGAVQLTGFGAYQRDTRLENGANLEVTGRLYQETTVYADAAVRVGVGASLKIANLDDSGAAQASLGFLPNGPGALVIDGGTLTLTATTNSTRSFTVGDDGATIAATAGANVVLSDASVQDIVSTLGGTLTLGGDGVGEFNKSLGGAGGLVKQGSGRWTLGGVNNYLGPTQVNAGALVVAGRTGPALTSVASGATLSGDGLTGPLVVDGTLAPGIGVGTLETAAVTLGAGSTLAVELFDLTSCDQLAAAGELVIEPGAGLAVTFAAGSSYVPTVGDLFTIATASGGITGSGFDALSLPTTPGMAWDVLVSASDVKLQVVPAESGDFNGDGAVDGADFLAWQRGLGITSGAQSSDGDANGDGAVDAADLGVWQTQFGTTPAPEQASVPEPAGAILTAVALAVASLRRQRYRVAASP